MRRVFRSTLPIAALAAAAAATALLSLRADAQSPPRADPPRAEKPAAPAPPPARRPRDDSDSAQAIEDDPTVGTGDEQESADSNLSFPVDI